MKILYLCNHDTFSRKMSRVRFHIVDAIGKYAEVTWSGIGWPNYKSELSLSDNIKMIYGHDTQPDLLLFYKPLELRGVKEVTLPKCIQYNEMYNANETIEEIVGAGANLVICHHRNDMEAYLELLPRLNIHLTLTNIPHCANPDIYKDYGLPKKYDVLLVGATHIKSILGAHYPLRDRVVGLLPKLQQHCNATQLTHPGYDIGDAFSNSEAIRFAKEINSAKICVTCSGVPRSRFGKYAEIPMCRTAIAADLPNEDHEFFRKFLIELDMSFTDDQIIDTLLYYVKNDRALEEKTRIGYELSSKFTTDNYAKTFLEKATRFLANPTAKVID